MLPDSNQHICTDLRCTHRNFSTRDGCNPLRLSETPDAYFGIPSAFLTSRDEQLMTSRETEQTSCRVEISGWDAAENFFVEKTVLRRCDDGSQKALLHTLLRVGALGFARLTDEPTPDRAVPITYQVATIKENSQQPEKKFSCGSATRGNRHGKNCLISCLRA